MSFGCGWPLAEVNRLDTLDNRIAQHALSKKKTSFPHYARAGTARATVLSLPGSPAFLLTSSYVCMRTTVKHHVAGTVKRTVLAMAERYKIDGKSPSLKMGNYTLQVEVDEVGAEYEKIAREELRETPDVVADSVTKLRELLEAETDLNVPLDDGNYLYRFLRPCKFYPDSALDRMKKFYRFRLKHPELAANISPVNERNVFEQDLVTILPKRTQCGRRIMVIDAGKKWKPRECALTEIFKAVMIVLEASLIEPRTQICGAEVILDMCGLSMQHVLQFTPGLAMSIAHWTQVHFHGTDWKSFHTYIVADSLPLQYGGLMDIPENTGPKLHELLCRFKNEFEERNTHGYTKKSKVNNVS
uniref:CRAL/TRIO N-terminal domain-containing protein n=1 Tax=Timema monikensis TaxID=170555 RepID=A0A7R9HRK6_9NEOP|nr:unnamed protein product [Timema monikensis]